MIRSLVHAARDASFDTNTVRFQVSGRLHAHGERLLNAAISPEFVVSCQGERGAQVAVDLRRVPIVGRWTPACPYPVDFVDTFFIPADATRCILADGTDVACVGKFDRRDNSIRLDAVDQDEFYWLWVGLSAK